MTRASTSLTRRAALGLAGGAMLWPVIGRAAPVEGMSGRAFGTEWLVTAGAGQGVLSLRSAIDQILSGIDGQMSPWRHDSDISRFNTASSGAYSAPKALTDVTSVALDVAASSNGWFDPTVGPLVGRWGFGPITGGTQPDLTAITSEDGVLSKTSDAVTLDLCGIAKGWALDRLADLAHDALNQGALLDLGGELAAVGQHPSGRNWQVGIAPSDRSAPGTVLSLPPGWSVATSGRSHQSYDLGSRSYGHIIDPVRQEPAENRLFSVTVLNRTATLADAWATALFAAGEKLGPVMAEARNIDAVFLMRGGDGHDPVLTGNAARFVL